MLRTYVLALACALVATASPAGADTSASSLTLPSCGTMNKVIAIASDPVNGPVVAYRNLTGAVFVKEGSLNAGWVQQIAKRRAVRLRWRATRRTGP